MASTLSVLHFSLPVFKRSPGKRVRLYLAKFTIVFAVQTIENYLSPQPCFFSSFLLFFLFEQVFWNKGLEFVRFVPMSSITKIIEEESRLSRSSWKNRIRLIAFVRGGRKKRKKVDWNCVFSLLPFFQFYSSNYSIVNRLTICINFISHSPRSVTRS